MTLKRGGSKRQMLRKERIYKARLSLEAPRFDRKMLKPKKRVQEEDEADVDDQILPDEDMIDYGSGESEELEVSSEEENADEAVRPLKTKQVRFLLPVKVDGKIIDKTIERDHSDDEQIETSIEQEQDIKEEAAFDKEVRNLSAAELLCEEHRKAQQFKADVASRCMTIVQTEESEIVPLLSPLVDSLRKLSRKEVFKASILIVSLAEVFLNITPGYRVRIPTEKEKAVRVKKSTLKLRNFEEGFLTQYRKYLECLEAIIKEKRSPPLLKTLSTKSLCKLLLELRQFNYSPNIIRVLIPCLESKNKEVSENAESCLTKLLREDKDLNVSEHVVRAACKWIKQRHFKVGCKVINIFLHLNIRSVHLERPDKSEKKEQYRQLSRREKKRLKETASLRKAMQENTAAEKNTKLLNTSTGIMEQVFHCYFRVMRSYQRNRILEAVLQGLSTFAHLINVDFNDSLMQCLREIIEEKKECGIAGRREILYCLITAGCVQLKQKPGLTGIDVDTTSFFRELYNILPELCSEAVPPADFELLLSCIKQLIIRQTKKLSRNRVLAFVKRLSATALNCSHDSVASSLILCIHQTLQGLTLPAKSMFMSDKGGVYADEVDHPDFCGAQNASLFELVLFQNSFSPEVRQVTKAVVSNDADSAEYTSVNEYFHRIKQTDPLTVVEASISRVKTKGKRKTATLYDDYLRKQESKMLPNSDEFQLVNFVT